MDPITRVLTLSLKLMSVTEHDGGANGVGICSPVEHLSPAV